ncbi:hypothetical protein F4813DRAFT_229123 [Daldinia decipiens]|uniref:uncharacterized protein n=1 Tax=Daldinia decipiens TaxID=326647 RepID=UPI0020C370EF|nr:uncharacterized protein F4813DRAFT_229123 [Daldinia decipiens]KAI1661430.1 hypothetical protein F4813DRAFT_229123 [Daldinia decipiens]
MKANHSKGLSAVALDINTRCKYQVPRSFHIDMSFPSPIATNPFVTECLAYITPNKMESLANCTCVLLTATTPILGFEIFTPEFLGTFAVIFPLAAYPFMFSDRNRTCQNVLGLTAMFALIIQIANNYAWAMGYEYAEFSPWLLPLTIFSAFVSLWDADGHESDVNWQPVPFVDPEAKYVMLTFYMFLSHVFTGVISRLEPATSTDDALYLMGLAFVGFRFAHDICNDFMRTTATIYHRLATRRVPGWFWIHADEPGLFRPRWSVVLTVVVAMSAPVLAFLWAYSMGYIVSISQIPDASTGFVPNSKLSQCYCTWNSLRGDGEYGEYVL